MMAKALGLFFSRLVVDGEQEYFHPHPLTKDMAWQIAHYQGADIYTVVWNGKSVMGYGLLRGWEEGYSVPSLGIALDCSLRGAGVAASYMMYLHAIARNRGASQIRLKVYKHNIPAVRLYERLGYRLESLNAQEWIGFYDLI